MCGIQLNLLSPIPQHALSMLVQGCEKGQVAYLLMISWDNVLTKPAKIAMYSMFTISRWRFLTCQNSLCLWNNEFIVSLQCPRQFGAFGNLVFNNILFQSGTLRWLFSFNVLSRLGDSACYTMLRIKVAGTLKYQGAGKHHINSILYCNSGSINALNPHQFSDL